MKIEINFSEVEYSDRLKRVSIRIEEDGKVKGYDECYDSTLVAIDQAKVIGSSIATFLIKEVQCFVEKKYIRWCKVEKEKVQEERKFLLKLRDCLLQ